MINKQIKGLIMASSSLFETVLEYLRSKPDQKFSSKQLGYWYCEQFKGRVEEKIRRTSVNNDDEARAQIIREISSQLSQKEKVHPQLKISGSSPVHYYYTALTESEESLVNASKFKVDEKVRTNAHIREILLAGGIELLKKKSNVIDSQQVRTLDF